jgi:hypothetical protein
MRAGRPTCTGASALSRDGRYVAFISSAPDAVRGDDNGVRDVFVRGPLSWPLLEGSSTPPRGKALSR